MALFDNHQKCARCRDKGVGDDPCVKKLDCQICKSFTPFRGVSFTGKLLEGLEVS